MARVYTKHTLEERLEITEKHKQKFLSKLDRIAVRIGQIGDVQQTLKTRIAKRDQVKP